MQVFFLGSRSAVAAVVDRGFAHAAETRSPLAPELGALVPLWPRESCGDLRGRPAALLDIPFPVLEVFERLGEEANLPRFLVYPELADRYPILAHRGLQADAARFALPELLVPRSLAATAAASVVLAAASAGDLGDAARPGSGQALVRDAAAAPVPARGMSAASHSRRPAVRRLIAAAGTLPERQVRRATRRPPAAPTTRSVAKLQRAVGVTPDGEFGPATERALADWQGRNGIKASGVANATTRAGLKLGAGPSLARSEKYDAPALVSRVIAGADAIATTPYRYGGGHGSFQDSAYDCSGSVSYALNAAGLLAAPINSSGFMGYGEPGPGEHITIYTNPGHVYMVVDGRRYDTAARAQTGTRWSDVARSSLGFVARHPPGL